MVWGVFFGGGGGLGDGVYLVFGVLVYGVGVVVEVVGWWGGYGEVDGVRGVLGGGYGVGYVFVGGDDFFGELMMVMIVLFMLKFFVRDERL